MKIFEDFLNKDKKENFYCEVTMNFSKITDEVRELAKAIDEAHKRIFNEEYKTFKILEDDSTTYKTILKKG